MPECHRELLNNTTQIAVWKITEDETQLTQGLKLSQEALNRLSQRKSIVHRKGYLAIRQLLKTFEIDPIAHQYDKNGAPYLTDGRHLSITHTKDVAAIAISTVAVGIDLEHYQEKIKKVAPRFLHDLESIDLNKNQDIEYLTQIWTAKEALYKVFRQPGIQFNTQLCIAPFEMKAPSGSGSIKHLDQTHIFKLDFRYFNTFCLSLASTKNVAS